jgi:hypothetical protein
MLTQHDTPGGTSAGLAPQDARAIASEAYIYTFPMAANYQTLYKQAIDTTSHDYRAPFNALTNASSVATPDDKFVVTPNSDTPYSYLWMDLRAEPIVVSTSPTSVLAASATRAAIFSSPAPTGMVRHRPASRLFSAPRPNLPTFSSAPNSSMLQTSST